MSGIRYIILIDLGQARAPKKLKVGLTNLAMATRLRPLVMTWHPIFAKTFVPFQAMEIAFFH